MIPVRLEVHNFLPYRSPDPLYFEGIHLACLTGHNGAGKSSLLDAITFALWGKARGKRDDDLLHIGQTDMYVQLDFEQEGTVYRVLRRRKGGKRGQGSLDLFTIQEDQSLLTINEPSMDHTQNKINEILRLDYTTFIHSAFLQQGKADAFTTKTPGERKKILANILGLDRWAQYEEAVKAQLKSIEKTLAGIEGALSEINEDLKKETPYRQEREAAQQAFEIADQARQDAEASLAQVQDAPATLRSTHEQMNNLTGRIRRFEEDLNALAVEIEGRERRIASYAEIVEQGEDIEAGYRALKEARQADSTLGARLREISGMNEHINMLSNQINSVRAKLESSISAQQASMAEIQQRINPAAQSAYETLSVQIAELEQIENQREELNAVYTRQREEASGLSAYLETMEIEGKRFNRRIDELNKAEGAVCPLCGQPLDEAHREQIIAEITQERDQMRETYQQTKNQIGDLHTSTTALKKQVDGFGDQLAGLPALRGRLGKLAGELEQSQLAEERFQQAERLLADLQQQLETEDYAHELRQQLAEAQGQRDAIQYDASEHETIQDQLNQFEDFELRHSRLQVARETLPREEESLHSALERQTRTHAVIAEELENKQRLEKEIQEQELRVQEYRRRETEANTQRTAATKARERVIVADQQLATLENQRKRRENLLERQRGLLEQQGLYQDLRFAFGKDGIPAMIIESAIPELESATNELLARMTDGRMHMRLVTQREKVSSSGTIETLDIEIADDLGTRPYEMYSGGEAFRIDFAIRVALSRMLARRAGAHLRTLFIDEGFGTQDDDGRNKLVEAINAIQQEFELILVITHIDELRDAFPVHIMVEKTANGSRIAVR